MTRPATDINKIASEMYYRLTRDGEANIDEVRLAFYEIMETSANINASFGVPDASVTAGHRVTAPFLPMEEVGPEDPIAAIHYKVDVGGAAPVSPQVITENTPIVGEVESFTQVAAPQESLLTAPTHEEVIIPQPNTIGKWTNLTLRVELGKHGFLEDPVRKRMTGEKPNEYRTFYVRRGYEVILVESQSEPRLLNVLGQWIDITQISFRNVNMRQPTEGGQT
ncbi:MAG: hypothetical protein H0U60_19560 [Blastocatellia bacterium]|nr:hypothetical protein [Blastocatellia bacterium]